MKRKKKIILLVEPGYINHYPPLGLMKISTWHKKQKDLVYFKKDGDFVDFWGYSPPKLKRFYDIIYITSIFTYHAPEVVESIKYYQLKYPKSVIKVGGILATLLPELIKKETGIEVHSGLFKEAESCPPDYSLFPKFPCSITFTSRGCKRKCAFCAVRKHEPKFFLKENWENDIEKTKRRIIFWDNNWLYSKNLVKDISKLIKLNIPFDFNQGLDCRLFDKEIAKLLSKTRIDPLRFAFDNHSEEGNIQKAIKLAKKYGLKDIRVYVLYNSKDDNDTPEYFFYRINEINKLGALAYPMRYRPIDSTNNHYVSPKWDKRLLRALKLSLMFYYSHGMIRRNRNAFKDIYGTGKKRFKSKLYKIYKYDQKLKREKTKREKMGNKARS